MFISIVDFSRTGDAGILLDSIYSAIVVERELREVSWLDRVLHDDQLMIMRSMRCNAAIPPRTPVHCRGNQTAQKQNDVALPPPLYFNHMRLSRMISDRCSFCSQKKHINYLHLLGKKEEKKNVW